MKKLLLLLIIPLLGFGQENSYEVVYIQKDINPINFEESLINEKSKDILAKSDSLAYIKAFESFCINVRVNEMMKQGIDFPLYTEVKSFQLLKENKDITETINFQNKKKIHNDVINIVFKSAPELLKKASNTLNQRNISKYRALISEESNATKILKLFEMKEKGALTEKEFLRLKQEILK